MLEISVVIPAYKCEQFIEKAILSCLENEEVKEVLVIIDGVFDKTEEIVKDLSIKDKRIKILYHHNKINKGAAASRNLGVLNSSFDYIAFLDADDFYLPNRFKETATVFQKFPDADGVYECIGLHAYDEESYNKFVHHKKIIGVDGLHPEYTTLIKEIPPENLFEALIYGNYGWFHFDGLTIKKACINKSGLLIDKLGRHGEDNEYFARLALKCRLYPGNIKSPVSKRGVYKDNVTLNIFENEKHLEIRATGRVYFYKIIYEEILKGKYDKKFNRFVLNKRLDYYSVAFQKRKVTNYRKIIKLFNLLQLIVWLNPLGRKAIWRR